jgi:glyoxylase-like metal-dependent hydrolase (beta-lactamase superfamily II)
MPEQQLPPPVISVVKDTGDVRIHTFVSPEAFLANATHIIESPNALVIIDGQFIVPFAAQFRAYADSLGKPINRVYLSHAHPDHFFGLGASFADVPIYALSETMKFLDIHGEAMRAARQKDYGPFVADKVALPTKEVILGEEVIDGVRYYAEMVADTETDYLLTLKLPDLGVYIVADLLYSGAHLYITKDTAHWTQVLKDILNSGCDLFLAGHGPAADKTEVETNIEYLTTAAKEFQTASGPDAYKAAMLAAYPNRTGAAILDIYVPRLYGTGAE